MCNFVFYVCGDFYDDGVENDIDDGAEDSVMMVMK